MTARTKTRLVDTGHVESFDFAGDCELGPFLDDLVIYEARIMGFVARGPGGGNPCVTLAFSSARALVRFREYYDEISLKEDQ